MTRQEFDELTENYSPLDEVMILSPGGKELILTELDFDAINRTGKIVVKTEWANKPLVSEKPKKKYKKHGKNRTKGPVIHTGLRGRPRKVRPEE